MANAHDFISALPEAYDTKVSGSVQLWVRVSIREVDQLNSASWSHSRLLPCALACSAYLWGVGYASQLTCHCHA